MTKIFYNGDRSKFILEKCVAIHIDAYELYKETREELAESIKILNHKGGIRYTTRMKNNIEATHTSVAVKHFSILYYFFN